MDVRWLAYLGSGLLAAVSLVPLATHAPTSAPGPAAGQGIRRDAGPDPALVDVERQAARLREHAAVAPVPRRPARNPFRFGRPGSYDSASSDRRSARDPSAFDRASSDPTAGKSSEPLPHTAPLALVGMAESRSGDTTLRTAIISGGGEVHLVGVGDRINNRFTVVAIGADAVELRDDETQDTLRLALRQPLL